MKIDRTTPKYLRADDLDSLARQNVQLMTELWITKDRLILLENLLEKAGLVDRAALDEMVPEGDLEAEILAERRAYITRIMETDTKTRSADTLSERAVKKPG